MSTDDITMTKRAAITRELRRLAQIVINIVETNGFRVMGTFSRSNISRFLKCGPFNIEIYLYPHIDCPPHIWITSNTNEPDLDSLANQLRLTGFEVSVAIEMGRLR